LDSNLIGGGKETVRPQIAALRKSAQLVNSYPLMEAAFCEPGAAWRRQAQHARISSSTGGAVLLARDC
jgi:hypothetical protein